MLTVRENEVTQYIKVYNPLQVLLIGWSIMFVNQTQLKADKGTFCCNVSHM